MVKENSDLRDKRDKATKKVKHGLEKYFKANDMDIPSIEFVDQYRT